MQWGALDMQTMRCKGGCCDACSVQVGSLEEVITRMAEDEGGPWSNAMMLVPPGSMEA